MKEKLEKLLDNAYAPYSNYQVSCIVKTIDDKEFIGVNVENASYGATICAERVAITQAVANGYKKGDIKEIHIMNRTSKFSFPCFICRQVLSEFMEEDMKVFLYTMDRIQEYSLKDLCPYPFTEENL